MDRTIAPGCPAADATRRGLCPTCQAVKPVGLRETGGARGNESTIGSGGCWAEARPYAEETPIAQRKKKPQPNRPIERKQSKPAAAPALLLPPNPEEEGERVLASSPFRHRTPLAEASGTGPIRGEWIPPLYSAPPQRPRAIRDRAAASSPALPLLAGCRRRCWYGYSLLDLGDFGRFSV